MNVIMQGAEKMLRNRTAFLTLNDPHLRCMFIRLSQVKIEQKDWSYLLIATARDVINEDNIDLYFCQDSDVFVVGRTLTYKKLEQFMTHLTQKLAPVSLAELASLFEFGVDGGRIRAICDRKIENIKILQNKRAQEASKARAVSSVDACDTLDHDLVSSLCRRRKERKTLEVLAVEDDPFSQKLIKNVLEKYYSLTLTGDGRGAILNYLRKAPDILFLDIGLPDIDGHEVLKKIFEMDPDAYVVMFSGKGDRENVMRAIDCGAKGFIGKPFTQEKLLQYIDKSPFVIAKMQGVSHGNHFN